MAVLKHIASKNADYRAAFNYLVYQQICFPFSRISAVLEKKFASE
jgi:hypothetical protein